MNAAGQRSAHAFVDKKTGEVYKSASWKSPAKGVRYDLRMHSGIATMSRELVLGTVHHYDWVQIAGAIKHPEANKVVDLSQATRDMVKIPDAYVKLYPTDGYGSDQMLFAVMQAEKPDAIMHFTDPRFWGWLYAIEKQVRAKVPLTYLHIWDDLPKLNPSPPPAILVSGTPSAL